MWVSIGAVVGWLWTVLARPTGGAASSVGADITTGIIVAAIFALAGVAFSLTAGVRVVLAVSGARPADPARYPQLCDLVEALAIGEGLPKPDVYVIDDPSPNAFATGSSPKRAAITATTELLRNDEPRRARRGDRPRDKPHQELRRALAPRREHPDRGWPDSWRA